MSRLYSNTKLKYVRFVYAAVYQLKDVQYVFPLGG